MNSDLSKRLRMILGGILAACLALAFAVSFFDVLTPPRDINALLNPTRTPTPFVFRSPVPTETPAPAVAVTFPIVLFDDNLSTAATWPTGPEYTFRRGSLTLSPSPNSDNLVAAPTFNFTKLKYDNLTLDADAAAVGTDNTVSYGIFFWHSRDSQKRDQFLAFTVSRDGLVQLRAYELVPSVKGGSVMQWVDLVPAGVSQIPAVRTEPKHIEVQVGPHHVSGFVNQTQVLDFDSPTIDQFREDRNYDGQVGLIVVPGRADSRVRFSRFTFSTEASSP